MNVNVYQSSLTGHWLVDKHGSKQHPGHDREGFRDKWDALTSAWSMVADMPSLYANVVVQS